MQKFVHLNTVLIPPREVSNIAISLSKKLDEKYKTKFVLDGINFHPHITLYSPEYPEKNISKIFEAVQKIAWKTQKVKLNFKSVSEGDDSIVVDFVLSDEVKQLHQKIIESLNPLREGRIPEKYQDKEKFNSLSQGQKENILKYGVWRCAKLYNPHITITTIEDENQLKQALSETKWKIKEFTADKIGVYTMGENGTYKKLLKEFKFQI